jgi:hypothetical protein
MRRIRRHLAILMESIFSQKVRLWSATDPRNADCPEREHPLRNRGYTQQRAESTATPCFRHFSPCVRLHDTKAKSLML